MNQEDVVFHGRLGALYQLAKEGKIATTLQGSHTRPCKFWTAMKILSGIRGAVVIAHGPSGCAFGVKQAYKLTNSRNSGSPYESVLTTDMNMENIIFGGEKSLKGAIKEVDEKYHPDVIVVATSCAAGIIGDNVDSVVDKMRSSVAVSTWCSARSWTSWISPPPRCDRNCRRASTSWEPRWAPSAPRWTPTPRSSPAS